MKPRDQFGLDALLGRWPAQDPQENGGKTWDDRAQAITDAATALSDRAAPDVLDALLAAPPLEAEPGEEKAADFQFDDAQSGAASAPPGASSSSHHEGRAPSIPAGGTRPMSSDAPKRPSLKDLAARASQAGAGRASITPLPPAIARSSAPPPSAPATVTPIAKARATTSSRPSDAGREDSGILRLADLQAEEAAKAEAAAAAAEAAVAAQRAASEAPKVAAPVVAAAAPPAPSSNKTGMWAGVAIAVVGVAAAFAIFRTRQPDAPPRTETASQPAPGPTAVAEAPKPAETAAAATAVANSDPAPAATEAPKADDPVKAAAGTTAAAPSAVASNDVKPAASSTDKPLKGSQVGTLDEEIKKAAGGTTLQDAPQDDGSKPAAGGGGNLPEQPSQGNAQAAIRSVMPGAKACVAGATEPTTGSVTFASSGSVTSVSVGGWAASNGKAACVKSALQGARVSPFAKPSFTVPVTVRP